MGLIISASDPSLLPPISTATSASGATTFVVDPSSLSATSAPASTLTTSSHISQLSNDLQSMLTDLQDINSAGGSASAQIGQEQANTKSPNRAHGHYHGGHHHSDSIEASGLTGAGATAISSTSSLQSDANSVVSDLFNLISASTPKTSNSLSSYRAPITSNLASDSIPIDSSASVLSSGISAPTTIDSASVSTAQTSMQSLLDLLAGDFARAVRQYSSANLQTGTTSQTIAAA